MNKREENIYKNLNRQISKLAKHNRQGSFKTKERYYQGLDRFCKFIAKEFGTQKFANIADKHLESYIKYMQNKGLSSSTVKTDLAAIRFFHDKCSQTRNVLSDNSKFKLEKRSFGGVDRSWSREEYKAFQELCINRGMDRVLSISILAKNEGLRIHETLKMNRSQVEKAMNTGILNITGKGGKEREVPLSQESKNMLQEHIQNVERGQKLFIREDEKTHLVIKQVQNFINRNREYFQENHRDVNITFHGLRHSYAKGQYKNALEKGLNDYQARLETSKLLGHERDDVTRIYLAK